MLKLRHLDGFIILLLFALLPIDMVNGILLKNNILLPISIGQFFKIILIFLLLFRFLFSVKYLIVSIMVFLTFLTPSYYQLLINFDLKFFFNDFIKVSRYLLPLLSFLFFIPIIKRNDQRNITKLFSLVKFSYIFLLGNIFLKLFGLGYPMYEFGNIGSKGFFYAGNEISALLIILASIIGYDLWIRQYKIKYFAFFILNIIVGLFISTKTGIFGIVLVFFLIPVKKPTYKVSVRKLNYLFFSTFILLPFLIFISWKIIKNSPIFFRLAFFWESLDFWTFVLSSRNKFLNRAFEIYKEQYNILEKLIGVGQTKYETLNQSKIVEIDVADIFFAYGFLGLLLFCFVIYLLLTKARNLSKFTSYYYANFVFLMTIILLSISTLAGHVFSSGMSAIFVGFLFSSMYLRQNESIKE